MMVSRIKVQIRQVYGLDTVYPACPIAGLFARIAGTKTLTAEILRCIDAMGIEIEIEHPRVTILRTTPQ